MVLRCGWSMGGERLVFAESAFDVAEDWTEQPRYGFVSDYGA